MKIKTTLALLGVWFSVSAAIAFMLASSIALSGRTQREYTDLITAAAANHAASVELYLESLAGGFAALSETVALLESGERLGFLQSYADSRPNIIFVGVNHLSETVGEGDHADLSARLAHIPADGKVYLAAFAATPTREYGLAIRGALGESDTLIVVYSPDVANNLIESPVLPAEGRLALVDPLGNVSDRGRVVGALPPPASVGEIRRNAAVGDSGWTAFAIGDVREMQEIADDSLDGLLVAVVLLCGGGIILTILLTRKFANPLESIGKAMTQFRRGDRAVRISLSAANGRNEYGELAARFNDFADSVVAKENDSQNGKKPEKLRLSRISLDSLTHVYSDRSIKDYITERITDEEFTPFAVIYVALRNFTEFNNTHSHAGGDLALRFTARELSEVVDEYPNGGKVGRYGGDEFVLVIREAGEADARKISTQIRLRLKSGYTEDTGKQVVMQPEIGITIVTDTPAEVNGVISAAINNMRGNRS